MEINKEHIIKIKIKYLKSRRKQVLEIILGLTESKELIVTMEK